MEYDLFISYAHKDNARGQVGELRDAILADFHQFAGRGLNIFFDEHDIPSMADWEGRIARGLRESRLFLAVLSPDYFASAYCRREWEEYVRYEAMRQCLGEGVAPVYFVELDSFDGPGGEAGIAEWMREMRRRQWCDLLPWHEVGKRALEDAHVAGRLHTFKGEIGERLRRADGARHSPTNVYRHNPQFVGRVRELTLLREALNERGSVGVVGPRNQPAARSPAAVHGLGGMGKTELALAYAHAFAWDYPGGRWLARCEGLDDFDLVLRQLAEPLNVTFTEEEQKDARRAAARILVELGRRDRALLMLDNVTHPRLLGPDVLMRLPPQDRFHLLATTRLGPAQLGGSPHDHTFVAVDELPAEDAFALVRAHQPGASFSHGDAPAARELVAILDGFTLAVETAAIYLGRHAAPGVIEGYIERLRRAVLSESESAAADPRVAVRHKEKLLEHTLAITFETLGAEQLHVLALAALLPADQVALPWLRSVAREQFPAPEQDDGPSDVDSSWRLAASLVSLRLFQPGGDERVVRMHRLVQELLKKRTAEAVAALDRCLLEHIRGRAQSLWEGWVKHEHRWELAPLTACAWQWLSRPGDDGAYLASYVATPLKDLGELIEAERLLRQALAAWEENVGPDHPTVAAALNNLAQLLEVKGDWDEAESLLLRAQAIDEKVYGPDHDYLAFRYNNLGKLLKATDRLSDAEPLLRRALAAWEGSLGPEHWQVGDALFNLAGVLRITNRLAEAEPLLRRALAIWEAAWGPDHPRVGAALASLGELLRRTGRTSEAEPLLRRALAITEQCLGPEHRSVAAVLNNLASLLLDANRNAEAEPLLRHALAITERAFGPEHPHMAGDLNGLGRVLMTTNRLDEAEPLLRKAVSVAEAGLGENHSRLAIYINDLALLLQAANRPAEAEPLLRRALGINEQTFGPNHPEVAANLGNLGLLVAGLNRPDEAEPLLRRALSISEQSFGPDHVDTATGLNNLGQTLLEMGRLDEAEPLLRRALPVMEKNLGPDHPHVAAANNNLARILQTAGRPAEAEPLLRRALSIHERSLGPDHPQLATSLNNLGTLLQDLSKWDEAETVLRRALDIYERGLGPLHPAVAKSLNNLGYLLYATSRFDEAEPLLSRALEIYEQTLGTDHTESASCMNNLALLLWDTGRLTRAETLLHRALVGVLQYTSATGHDHPSLLGFINNYAGLLEAMGFSQGQALARVNELSRKFGMSFE